MKKITCLIIALGAVLTMSACVKVDSGHGGILWKAIGGTKEKVYGEGWHMVAPWNRMYVYNIRTMDAKEVLHILTNNGLSVDLETSVRFRPVLKELVKLHVEIGPEYYSIIIGPTIRSEARKVGGRYLPEEIYSTKREIVEKEIYEETIKALEGKHIQLEAILIRDVGLPEKIKNAISEKLEEEQKALKMKFVLQREQQEAERKRIEAKGIADFQKIVTAGISENLLRWKGIEATEKLANSTNTKIIVVGAGKDGLPLILGGQ